MIRDVSANLRPHVFVQAGSIFRMASMTCTFAPQTLETIERFIVTIVIVMIVINDFEMSEVFLCTNIIKIYFYIY
jgi:hypothetical protein